MAFWAQSRAWFRRRMRPLIAGPQVSTDSLPKVCVVTEGRIGQPRRCKVVYLLQRDRAGGGHVANRQEARRLVPR